jgi:hypothetical protein
VLVVINHQSVRKIFEITLLNRAFAICETRTPLFAAG